MFVISHWFSELPFPSHPFLHAYVEAYVSVYFCSWKVKRMNLRSSSLSAITVLFMTRKEIVSANNYHKYVTYLQIPSWIN